MDAFVVLRIEGAARRTDTARTGVLCLLRAAGAGHAARPAALFFAAREDLDPLAGETLSAALASDDPAIAVLPVDDPAHLWLDAPAISGIAASESGSITVGRLVTHDVSFSGLTDAPGFAAAASAALNIQRAPGTRRSATRDAAFRVMDAFAHVARLPARISRSLAGRAPDERGVAPGAAGPLASPWLNDQPVALPPSRRTQPRRLAGLSREEMRSAVFSAGCLPEERRIAWRVLFAPPDQSGISDSASEAPNTTLNLTVDGDSTESEAWSNPANGHSVANWKPGHDKTVPESGNVSTHSGVGPQTELAPQSGDAVSGDDPRTASDRVTPLPRHESVESLSARIRKDVLRTDRTEAFFHPEATGSPAAALPRLRALEEMLLSYALAHPSTGYLQGMHELAATALWVAQGETGLASAVFAALMAHQAGYCADDGAHMHAALQRLAALLLFVDPALHERLCRPGDAGHMLFAVRWLLLLFKRDVSPDAHSASGAVRDGANGGVESEKSVLSKSDSAQSDAASQTRDMCPADMDPRTFLSVYGSLSLDSHARIVETVLSAPVPHYEVVIAAALLVARRDEVAAHADASLGLFGQGGAARTRVSDALAGADRILARLQATSRAAATPLLSVWAGLP